MDISSSIFGLAKNNNGFFKSEKQASFLISQLELESCIGFASSGYHSCPIFAEFDDLGITRITKSSNTTHKTTVVFERRVQGQLTDLQAKEIKKLSRKMENLVKELQDDKKCFEDGSYNSSGDITTYTALMIQGYLNSTRRKEEQIEGLRVLKETLK